MRWTGETSFDIGGYTFFSCVNVLDLYRDVPVNGFIIGKSKSMLETLYERLAHLRGGNIVELGVFRGGSTVWLSEMFKPRKLVAFEFGQKPAVDLERYIEQSQKRAVVRPYYGVNQKHPNVLRNKLRMEFGNEPLDFVIDDASHMLEETRVSFNVLFPRLRPGGIFVLEDWGWGHIPLGEDEPIPREYVGQHPLTTLVMEALMCCAQRNGVVEDVYVDGTIAYIQRGNAKLNPKQFDISTCYSVMNGFRFTTGFEK